MQQQRRTNPYPWTWEPAVIVSVALGLLLVLGAQTGRSMAVATAGHGWWWPTNDQLFRSLPGVLTGHAEAGLPLNGPAATPIALAIWIIVVELTLTLGGAIAGMWAWSRWGTGAVRGMASRAETNRTLGVTRLYKVRRIIRPDLYGPTATVPFSRKDIR